MGLSDCLKRNAYNAVGQAEFFTHVKMHGVRKLVIPMRFT